MNRKIKREALVPISAEIASQIGAQIAHVRTTYSPDYSALPPDPEHTEGTAIPGPSVFNTALKTWVLARDICDEHRIPIHLTAHQFRDTLGTRLTNNDVPQKLVRKVLDPTLTKMTAHYARSTTAPSTDTGNGPAKSTNTATGRRPRRQSPR